MKRILRTITDRILALQTPDGAFSLGKRVVPYFGNFGALGLVTVAQNETDVAYKRRLLDTARRWTHWYDAHRNPDGTIFDYEGTSGAWKSTGKYDSTDSYASTYLELQAVLGDKDRYPFVKRSVGAMGLTRQKNGLTTATPKWPVMYTMDNVEVLRGLRAAVHIAETLKQSGDAKHWSALAAQTETAILRELWDTRNHCYLVGLQTDGGKMDGLKKWYPNMMANLMAVGWLPRSERHRALYRRLVAEFSQTTDSGVPTVVQKEEDLERLVWWGFAAQATGDTSRCKQIEATLTKADYPRLAVTNPATLGHICRLLTAEGNTAS